MANTDYIAYYRVSGARQGETGIGLESQRDEMILRMGRYPRYEYTDVKSGSRKKLHKRSSFAEAVKKAIVTGLPLVVYKLDRMGRDTELLSKLYNNNVQFIALDFPPLDNVDRGTSRMIMGFMMAFAEYESHRGSQRSSDAAKVMRKRGMKLGNPNPDIKNHSRSGGESTVLRYWNAEKQSVIDILRARLNGEDPTKYNLSEANLLYLRDNGYPKYSKRSYMLRIINQYHIVLSSSASARLLLDDVLK